MRRTYRKNKIKETIIRHIENNFKTYLVLIIVFFIGLILGIMFINNAQNDSQKEIDSYIHNFSPLIILHTFYYFYKISQIEVDKKVNDWYFHWLYLLIE